MSDAVSAWLDQHSVHTVRTEGVSPDGVVVGKYLSRSKFESSLLTGVALSEIAFGVDLGAQPHIGWWPDWREPFLGDIHQQPDTSTLVLHPWRPGFAACVVDHVSLTGEPLSVCVRSLVKRLSEHVGGLGYEVRMSAELEMMLFEESLPQARTRGFKGLTPLGGSGAPAPYSVPLAYEAEPFFSEVRRRLDGMGIPWEAVSKEAALGQFEVNLEPADPVATADRLMRTREVMREVALDLGHSVTFMAKPVPETYGSGTHIHHSLWRDGRPAFCDEAGGTWSTTMRHWLGGLMATLSSTVSFLSPTVNSYRRFVGFAAAPTTATWCEDNKSTAIRTVSRSPAYTRIEHRVAAADVNPYLLVAAVLAGGIIGLEDKIEPPDEFRYVAWGVPDHVPRIPTDIVSAAIALEEDARLSELLGKDFVEHWVNTRRYEWLQFHTTGGDPEATETTDWELKRYFETV